MNAKRPFAALLLAGAAFAAHAADSAPITGCVDLGGHQEIIRAGSVQSMLLRNDDAYYRLGFRRDCSSLATASSIEISTGGAANRLCPEGSKVKTNRATCPVATVESIDAEQYATLKKRASR